MTKSGKIWGEDVELLATPALLLHRITVLPNSFCSWHKHEHRCNAFVVTRGTLTIEVRQRDYPLTDRTVLEPGEIATVAPGLVHRFVTGAQSAEALELYYLPAIDPRDIVRLDVGGREVPE